MAEEYNPDIITLSDESGKEFVFEVLDAIESDEGRYLALLPQYDDPQEMLNDSGELVILKVSEDEDGEYYEEIEDDDEYDLVSSTFLERLDGLFEIEDDVSSEDTDTKEENRKNGKSAE